MRGLDSRKCMADVGEILTFWFGDPAVDDTRYDVRRKLWFRKDPEVDRQIRSRFLPAYDAAVEGQLDEWQKSREGALALILVYDQFPRNMFRDDPQAFATDAKARVVAQRAIAQGFDQELPAVQRIFVYLPLEHSEELRDQNQSVELFRQLAESHPELSDTYDYALRHQEVIERFGRFPHRNDILGRETTPEEAEFLKQPGSSF